MMNRKILQALRIGILCCALVAIWRPCNRRLTFIQENEQIGFKGDTITCAIALGKNLQESLKYGLHYQLLQDFAETEGCEINIITITDSTDYADSLRKGVYDIVALRTGRDSLDFEGIDFSWSYDGAHALAVAESRPAGLKEVNWRLQYLVNTGQFNDMEEMFRVGYNPFKIAENGGTRKRLSPYDASIKKYAKMLGWDWRMLAALIYKESKFTINNVSHRGAVGLMQVRPSTATRYGVTDLLNPEQNIMAGTTNIKIIQDNYFADGFDLEEKEKFTLAAYNAGVGRIADCRRLAAEMGKDNHVWSNIVSVIPYMHDEEYLDSTEVVQYGYFNGAETIAYVESVKEIYDTFCAICPYSK